MSRAPQLPQRRRPRNFGGYLSWLRRSRRFTQKGLVQAARDECGLAGIVESALSHWERNQRVPSPPQLLALASVLDLEAAEVLRLVDYATKHSPLYAGAWSAWEAAELTPEARYRAWGVWAGSQTTRPQRRNPKKHGATPTREGAPEPVVSTDLPRSALPPRQETTVEPR